MRRHIALLLPILLLVACSGHDAAEQVAPTTTSAVVEPSGVLTDRTCRAEDRPADCYTLEVPEVHGQADGGPTLRLPVVVHHPAEPRGEEPILVPDGGPGASDFDAAWPGAQEYADLTGRDTIYWGQRGTAIAEPSLYCPELAEAVAANFGVVDPDDEERARLDEASTACHERLVAEGNDLGAYDTVQNAYDAVALRRGLGIERWNVLGVSYGGRIAEQLLRVDPDGVRAAVLDSAARIGVGGAQSVVDRSERALDELFDACATDAACATAHPGLRERFEAMVEDWDAHPRHFAVTMDDGTVVPFIVDGADLYGGAVNLFYDPNLIRQAPMLLTTFEAGDLELAPALGRNALLQIDHANNQGMGRSVSCADGSDVADPHADELRADPGPARDLLFHVTESRFACDTWEVEPADDGFLDPVATDVPVLVLSGRFDQVAPPDTLESLADQLGGTFVSFADAGHAVQGTSPCSDEIVNAFYDHPTAPVDTSCAEAITGPDFA
jgi:pimeloyl-ACP methyl ester carboxylesterase